LFAGPKLPKASSNAAMALSPDGSKHVYVGGELSTELSSTDLYELNCSPNGICEWNIIPLKLTIGRKKHVAMFIPGNMTDCGKLYF
jgi:hypothetical protein